MTLIRQQIGRDLPGFYSLNLPRGYGLCCNDVILRLLYKLPRLLDLALHIGPFLSGGREFVVRIYSKPLVVFKGVVGICPDNYDQILVLFLDLV